MDDQAEDRQAIIDLTVAYCRILDRGDFAELANVFTPEASAELGGSGQTGFAEISERLSSALGKFVSWKHTISDHEVHVDGDHATSRCSVHAVHVRPAGERPTEYLVTGVYEDRLVRTRDGWRITYRSLVKL